MKLAAISVTRQGNELGEKLKEELNLDFYSSYNNDNFNFRALCQDLMKSVDGIIFITSTGIAVRGIGNLLKGKDKDPAIVVVDSQGKFSISLAGGHLGGANDLAKKVADILGAMPVITTATDNMNLMAPDIIAKDNNLIIDDLKIAKTIAAKLVDGELVGFWDEDDRIPLPRGYVDKLKSVKNIVTVSNKVRIKEFQHIERSLHLKLIRKNVVLGMGCRKNVDEEKIKTFVVDNLNKLNIDSRAVKVISTVDVKKDEKGLIGLSNSLGCPMHIHSREEIKQVQYKYKGSDFVEKSIGVRCVCEPCVELEKGILITEKISFDGMTLCVGIVNEL